MVDSGARAVAIRVARPEDLPTVLAADVFDGPALDLASRRFLGPETEPDPRNILVLAWLDDAVVGFASGTVLDHPDKPRNLFLQELGVNEGARRRGVARALIAALRAEGRARGCAVTWVLTEGDNDGARATYRSTGAAETEAIVMYEWDEDGAD